jgi:hypothetical protein
LITATLLVGCATSYQAKSFFGGYVDLEISEDIVEVEFWGNLLTATEKAADFAMYRCVEVTLLRGNNHFVVLSSELFIDRELISGGGGLGGPLYRETPRMYKRIKILNEHSREVVEHSAFVYDAKEMGQSLSLKYRELRERMLDQASLENTGKGSSQDSISIR